MPRAFCGQGFAEDPWLVAVSRSANLVIFTCYVAIPLLLLIMSTRIREGWTPKCPVAGLVLALLFIGTCGATHMMDYLMFTHPWYRATAAALVICALCSSAFIGWCLVESFTAIRHE